MNSNKINWEEIWDQRAGTYQTDNERLWKVVKLVGRGNTVLDCGCGQGELMKQLQKNNNIVEGIDFSKKMIAICKEKNLKVQVAEVEELPFEDNSFDVITAIGVFEYLDKDDKALAEIYRVLKPSGRAVIECRNVLFKRWSGRVFEPERKSYDPDNLSFEGFDIIKIVYYHPHWYPPKLWWKKKLINSSFLAEVKKHDNL